MKQVAVQVERSKTEICSLLRTDLTREVWKEELMIKGRKRLLAREAVLLLLVHDLQRVMRDNSQSLNFH